MHPQLDRNRFAPCEQLMEALEKCHQQEFFKRALGLCNFEKNELNKCLHYTRLQDSKSRIRENRLKQKQFEKRRKEIYEEEYGKDGYLKKVLEQHAK